MLRFILLTAICASCLVRGASWYVDNAATGSNNGTSWANAWPDVTSVVWGASGVTAGDTLFISGGTTNKTYTNSWTVGASGTVASPINIRVGQDLGHNGAVIWDGSRFGTSFTGAGMITCFRSNVVFNGSVNGSTNFVIRNWFNSTNKNLARGILGGTPGHNLKIFHTIISNVNSGIHAQSMTNITIGWCDIKAWGDACIAINDSRATPPDYWDSHLIFSNKITSVYNEPTGGPDGIQCLDGVSIFANKFETVVDDSITNRVSNHIDYLQTDGGKWMKIYGNELLNNGDSALSPAPFTAGRGLDNVRIYNNIFRITEEIDPFPQYIRMYNNAGFGGYTNVWILNNLFVDRTNATQGVYFGPEIGDAPGTNNIFANNIFVNVGAANGYAWEFSASAGAGQSEWTITNNILYHPNPDYARVRYLGTNYTAAQWKEIDPTTGTNLPSFVNYEPKSWGNNFRLSSIDTAALDTGFDYSSIFTNDFDRITRSSPWDMGPFEWFDYAETLPCDVGPRTINAYSSISSNSITIVWPPNEHRLVMSIDRRVYTNKISAWVNWTNIFSITNNPAELAGSFTDTNVSAGIRYTYQVTVITTNYPGCTPTDTNQHRDFQYINTGIQIPLKDTRGNLILLVESGVAGSLTNELRNLTNDFIGDGYKVYRHDTAAVDVTEGTSWTNAVWSTKQLITTDYNTDTNVDWTIFIVGHVPIPYSGLSSPGSHTENFGAHPADWYYADMDAASWTDSTVNNTTADYEHNWNVPGDGKFDQSTIPTAPELRVGRIDFRNLPAFGKTEVELLSQYLNRNHEWRHKQFMVRDRGVIPPAGTPGVGARPIEVHNLYSSAFGNTTSSDLGLWLTVATNKTSSYLFASSKGSGTFTKDNILGDTTNFASTKLFAVFTRMHGSYYGGWDSAMHSNVVMWAPLATDGYALSTWYSEQWMNLDYSMADEPIGNDLFTLAANKFVTESDFFNLHMKYHQFANIVGGGYFVTAEAVKNYASFLGDPTLRVRPTIPPTSVSIEISGADNVLTWTASTDTGLVGYHVYRAPSNNLNNFTRLTTVPDTASPYTDTGAASGSYTYMIRAIKEEDSANRSYYTASQGIFAEASGGGEVNNSAQLKYNSRIISNINLRP